MFDRLRLPSEADILEVGCGNGNLWAANRDRIPAGWRLTLTDISRGMIDEARERLGDLASYDVADVQELPFVSDSFDAVVANHMLFHVPDRERALTEITRVLRPDGSAIATTNGREHLRELNMQSEKWSRTFGLENGRAQLERFLRDVELERFPDSLEITEIEPLLGYGRTLAKPEADEDLARLAKDAQAAIARDGCLRVTKSVGLFRGRKP